MRETIINWFQNHPEIGIVGFFVGLILAVWSLIVTLKSRRKKRFSIQFNGNNLIADFSEKFNGLDIRFKSERVKNLTVTKIILWNSGNQTLLKNDIVSADPIRIVSKEDVLILDCQIIQENEKSNQFRLGKTIVDIPVNEVKIEFDYIDPRQGCVVQVLHNGSSYDDLIIEGRLKGVNKISGKNNWIFIELRRTILHALEVRKHKRIGVIILGIFFMLLGLLPITVEIVFFTRFNSASVIAIGMLSHAFIGYKILSIWMPKGLDSFEERI